MLAFTVTIKPRVEFFEKVKHAILDVASKTRKEIGCHTYNVHEIVETDGIRTILIYEIFSSQENFEFHISQDYTKDLLEYFKDSLINPVEIQKFETSLL